MTKKNLLTTILVAFLGHQVLAAENLNYYLKHSSSYINKIITHQNFLETAANGGCALFLQSNRMSSSDYAMPRIRSKLLNSDLKETAYRSWIRSDKNNFIRLMADAENDLSPDDLRTLKSSVNVSVNIIGLSAF